MWRRWNGTVVLSVIIMAHFASGQSAEPNIQTSIISVTKLPRQFDAKRTFHYGFSTVNPESMLTELWNAHIYVSEAWLPLDNLCVDPIGPRFTVVLKKEVARISDFHFTRGPGRLACATKLKRFTISQ